MNYPAIPRASNSEIIVQSINRINRGKVNATVDVTLTAASATTEVTDERISVSSAVMFMPMTANAAAELATGACYVNESDLSNGSLTITHNSNSQTDRKFRLLIIG